MNSELEAAEARFNELVREWADADELCRTYFREWEGAKRLRKGLKQDKCAAWAYLQAVRIVKAIPE